MTYRLLNRVVRALVVTCLLPVGALFAHGGGNWDPFTISVVNDRARDRIVETQVLVAEIIRGRAGADDWPLPTVTETRDALITAKEEVDEIIEHYVNDGINVQLPATLHAAPQVGRTVAASRALAAAIAIVERSATLASADAFVEEFYAGGLVASLYELLEAHADRMAVYALLADASETVRAAD
ncbi:MAG: hypothetical protein R3176_11775 [Woeseiaceae bacterium]|nr:hypothetical protein [Woeseiaceae bacterium]